MTHNPSESSSTAANQSVASRVHYYYLGVVELAQLNLPVDDHCQNEASDKQAEDAVKHETSNAEAKTLANTEETITVRSIEERIIDQVSFL